MDMFNMLKEAIKQAVQNNQRRMIVISGARRFCFALQCIKDVFSITRYRKILLVTNSKLDKEQNEFLKELKELSKKIGFEFEKRSFKESEVLMGTTQDFLILDLSKNLRPNDIGRLLETVRGGGLIIMLTPGFEKWKEMTVKYHEDLITPPYTLKDVRHVFIPWFIENLLSHGGIAIIDADNESIIKDLKKERKKERKTRELRIPEKTFLDKKLYEICLTQDQINVLKELERFFDKDKVYSVITANRGRGKSAIVGLFLAGYLNEIPCRIGVTSPELSNVQTFFEFLIKGLKALGREVRVFREEGKVWKVRIRKGFVEYRKPIHLLKRKYDVVFVDEAAGIPLPILYKIYDKYRKIIFASTIHGYEGAGRSFSVRFMKKLREEPKGEIIFLQMKEPIRYSEDDPIEKFVYDALLLNAEPPEIDEKDLEKIDRKDFEYRAPDVRELFFKQKDLLRQFIGIYVLAHYRNRPNDLMILADAPHHFPRMILLNGKVINAMQIAREGGLTEEWIKRMKKGEAPSGNIIPDRVLKYYGIEEFGKEIGYRIVRIATHPKLFGRGIGSFALKKLEEEAKKNGFGWIGSGFGVNYELLKFWVKNGFIPIHISPTKNEVSGEYSVIVVKPLNKKVEKMIKICNKDFREKLVYSLSSIYWDLEPDVARLLLHPFFKFKYKNLLSETQMHRLKGYVDGLFTYETVYDIVRKVSEWYFLNSERFLEDIEEKALIIKVLQCRSWREARETLEIGKTEILRKIRNAVKKIYKRLKGEKVEKTN